MLEICGNSHIMLENAYKEKLSKWLETLKENLNSSQKLINEELTRENYATNLENALTEGSQLLDIIKQIAPEPQDKL